MSVETPIEQRVAALEAAVQDLQRRLTAATAQGDWLKRLTGSLKDEPAFEEVLEFGRQFRYADRPAEDQGS